MTPAASHVRELDSLLSSHERRVLEWMARRVPAWVSSDQLTLVGLFGTALAGLAFWGATWHQWSLLGVLPALALNWFGDSLDGTLARVRHAQRPRYGFYVDHIIDVVGAGLLLGGVALSGYMSPLVALALLASYLMVSAEVYLATHACGVFRLSFVKLGPTELRIVLAIGALSLLHTPIVTLGSAGAYRLFDLGGLVAIMGLLAVFVVSAVRNTCALYRAEPIEAVRLTPEATTTDDHLHA